MTLNDMILRATSAVLMSLILRFLFPIARPFLSKNSELPLSVKISIWLEQRKHMFWMELKGKFAVNKMYLQCKFPEAMLQVFSCFSTAFKKHASELFCKCDSFFSTCSSFRILKCKTTRM